MVSHVDTLNIVRMDPTWYPEGMETAALISLIVEVIGLVTIPLCVLYLVNIFRRKPNFLLFYQLYVIVTVLYIIFRRIVPSSIIGYEYAIYDPLSAQIGSLVGAIIGFFLWTLYYCKSIRVRTYMGSDEYMDKAIFAYKDQPPLY